MVGTNLSLLLVDDDPFVLRALRAILKRYGKCDTATSLAAAETMLAPHYDGLVLDVFLGDGCGIDLLARARRRGVDAPAVILTGGSDRDTVNRAAVLGARFIMKPCGTSELSTFIAEALQRKTNDRVRSVLERARNRWLLTDREVAILEHALRARSRTDYLEQSGIAQNTYKTHVRKLLDKTDYANLSTLAIDLLASC
jgi:DNA-binding NarL/FixJ family response regulator